MDTESMNEPTEPGLYWATHVVNATEYDMIVQVVGRAPFLEVREWHNGKLHYTTVEMETIRRPVAWGPKVVFPKVGESDS